MNDDSVLQRYYGDGSAAEIPRRGAEIGCENTCAERYGDDAGIPFEN